MNFKATRRLISAVLAIGIMVSGIVPAFAETGGSNSAYITDYNTGAKSVHMDFTGYLKEASAQGKKESHSVSGRGTVNSQDCALRSSGKRNSYYERFQL